MCDSIVQLSDISHVIHGTFWQYYFQENWKQWCPHTDKLYITCLFIVIFPVPCQLSLVYSLIKLCYYSVSKTISVVCLCTSKCKWPVPLPLEMNNRSVVGQMWIGVHLLIRIQCKCFWNFIQWWLPMRDILKPDNEAYASNRVINIYKKTYCLYIKTIWLQVPFI